ncbi:transcriptional corepressor LEUNIG-like protein isoform X4 [Iris pallida]|uniref:Transcriptional corepressor LEUNIG-like protein isoform X4 n=1 Tax=Iris pallida TaxID=29817 RepID=A0AAX6FYD9_IRIPA|nr:transcriptional corepressor LEUNIG-like protein isoform X4 [Iris pallida]
MDPSSLYSQGIVQGKSAIGGAGLNQGGMPLKGWPLTGNFDQLRSSLSPQVQKPFTSSANQFQMMASQQQQIAQDSLAQDSLGNSHGYREMDPRRFSALPRGGQPSGNDGSLGSPMQSASPIVREDPTEYYMKMQQSSANLPQEQPLQQQQLQQSNRKRRTTSSGAANSTGTGNTIGPSSSPPSTPSTNTPGDRMATMASNLPHAGSMVKSSMMYPDGTGGLASSSNHMDDIEQFADIGPLDDFLHDPDANIFAPLKNSLTDQNTETSKGFAFTEMGSRSSNNKVLCCHFSSDGKLLASAGHEKKVLIWKMENYATESTPEEHTHMITDIRFRPDSTHLATSSFDRTVRLWNAAEPSFSLHTFTGHSSPVTSLDFHPKRQIFCVHATRMVKFVYGMLASVQDHFIPRVDPIK